MALSFEQAQGSPNAGRAPGGAGPCGQAADRQQAKSDGCMGSAAIKIDRRIISFCPLSGYVVLRCALLEADATTDLLVR